MFKIKTKFIMKKITFFNEHLINTCCVSKTKLLLTFALSIIYFSSYAQIPSNDLIASYNFENTLNDNTGSADLTATSSTAFQYFTDRIGRSGNALFVDGRKLTGYTFTGTNSDVTISFWAALNSTASGSERIVQFYDATGGGFRVEYDRTISSPNGGLLQVAVNPSVGTTGNVTSSAIGTSSNVWRHFVVTITKTPNNVIDTTVYIDGVVNTLLSGADVNTTSDLFTSNAPFNISPITANNGSFKGTIDDILIYNRALTAQEVSDIYNFLPSSTIIYVKEDATGNNDGTDWLNAYTDLNTAFSSSIANDEIWIAKGTYNPAVSDRSTSFIINKAGTKVYGGFAGTEVTLSDRDITLINTTNATILNGDLNGDDNAFVSYGNTTRDDNSLRIVSIDADNVSIDGITITNGYADGNDSSGQDRFGAALALESGNTVSNFTLKNSVIKNNVAWWAAGLSLNNTLNATTIIDGCIFEGNLASTAASFYVLPNSAVSSTVQITNCLFNGNRAEGNGFGRPAFGAPAGFLRAFNGGSEVYAYIVNNTYVNNSSSGTGGAGQFPLLAVTELPNRITPSTLVFSNNIIWGNTSNNIIGFTMLRNFQNANTPIAGLILSNSVDEDDFSQFFSSEKINISAINPNLTSDYKLQASSISALDSGDNSQIPANIITDLAGNNRIENTTVDIGAYEYGSTLSVADFDTTTNFVIYPNPTTSILNIDSQIALVKVEVFSILGKKVLSANSKSIDVSDLNSGIYVLKIIDDRGNQSTLKFIKE